jgi:mono/diheme cytochrome c family protein/plastocyanin
MASRRLSEWLGRTVVVLLAAGPPSASLLARAFEADDVVALRGAMPERGGWQPATLTAVVGESLRLRLTSGDVMHGFAIGRDHRPPVDVEPGRVTEIALRFDQPGTYTFYCTRWCGPNHWRMRGTIEVTGSAVAPDPTEPAPYLALGIDLDAPHPSGVQPNGIPSAARGVTLETGVPETYFARDYFRRHSPAAVWRAFRADLGLRGFTDRQLWDLVASVWRGNTSAAALETGRGLYARNCAACHGPAGRGDGVMVAALREALRAPAEDFVEHSRNRHTVAKPADFTDPDFLGASPVLLHGKIVRGGMGTGMPYWGPVFTDAETWALVDFLYGFQFAYDPQGGPR